MSTPDHNRTIVIQPPSGFVPVDLGELWEHRELIYFLALREVKVRYKQTLIGVAWVLLQPAITALLLSLIFSSFARFDSVTVPYPIFALVGIVLWLFVQSSITLAGNSLVGNANLVTKVYFPRLIVPISATLAAAFDLFVSLPILAAAMAYYGIAPTPGLLLVPLFFVLALLAAGGIGILFSSLNVRFRDVKFAVPFFLQVWMFASPIVYPAAIIPEKWRYLIAVNPLVGVVEGWRASLLGGPIDWLLVGVSAASLICILIVAMVVFRRMEDGFADHI